MSAQVTELQFLEHLAGRFNLPVPEHLTADAPAAEIREAMNRWGGIPGFESADRQMP